MSTVDSGTTLLKQKENIDNYIKEYKEFGFHEELCTCI